MQIRYMDPLAWLASGSQPWARVGVAAKHNSNVNAATDRRFIGPLLVDQRESRARFVARLTSAHCTWFHQFHVKSRRVDSMLPPSSVPLMFATTRPVGSFTTSAKVSRPFPVSPLSVAT